MSDRTDKTILLTGATGLVGEAILRYRPQGRMVALCHHAQTTAPDCEVVQGDVGRPRLGLSAASYRALAARTDAIVHCAAITDWTSSRSTVFDVNLQGTRQMLELAQLAQAPLYYLGTSFVLAEVQEPTDARSVGPEFYVLSKRAAEAELEQSGTPVVLIRPSIVIGDSVTGEISRLQGIHTLLKFLFEGQLTVMPVLGDSHIDVIPQDILAHTVAALVDGDIREASLWCTAGVRAPTASSLLDIGIEAARELGYDLPRPRLVDPEIMERLIRPAILPELPPRARRRLEQLDKMTGIFFSDKIFPSSWEEVERLSGYAPDFDLDEAIRSNVKHFTTRLESREEHHIGSR
jgi:thioester reductase-like protein